MTVKSGFFSDGSSYNQADFNAFLVDSVGTGYVLGYENELRVTPNTPANMGVFVRTGRCYVQGYYGWVTSNEALTVPTAHTTLPRIDRVVARLSVSVNQSVTFAVLTGTPATSPSAPALTRTSETYEISLARIAVGAGVTSITSANITDERGDATVCGVAGVKHSWSYLNNVAIDVSQMTVDASVSDRDPVYFNGTEWVVATNGAVGFYDAANDAVITAGYLDGFTGLTPGEIVGNRGVAITTTEIVVLETPIDSSGVKQVGDISGNFNGTLYGKLASIPYIPDIDTVSASSVSVVGSVTSGTDYSKTVTHLTIQQLPFVINTGADIIVKAKAEKTGGNSAVVLSSANMVVTYSDNTTDTKTLTTSYQNFTLHSDIASIVFNMVLHANSGSSDTYVATASLSVIGYSSTMTV